MTEEQFWHCTLRKLLALRDMHIEFNSGGPVDDEWGGTPKGYIDQLW